MRKKLAVLCLVVGSPMAANSQTTTAGAIDTVRCEAPIAGVVTTCGWIAVDGRYRVRSIITRPSGASRRLPAVLFVQWLSCDPIALGDTATDGWSSMLRGVIQRSRMVVARTEKQGMGDSGGPACSALGYDEELAAHRAALEALRGDPHVHPDSIFIFGASMGGTMAPLLAASGRVAGVIAAVTTAGSWLEHMIAIDRRVLELRGRPAGEIDSLMRDHIRFEALYLGELKTPSEAENDWRGAREVWLRTLGTDSSLRQHYGRPVQFHHEAQRHNWPRAWAAVTAPVLVIQGEFDWIMPEDEHRRIIAALSPGVKTSATYVKRAGMAHDFLIYRSMHDAFREQGGRVDTGVVDVIIDWLDRRRGARRP